LATIDGHPSEKTASLPLAAAQRVLEWETLYERHHRDVLALCRRITGDPVLAEDLTQETFIRILQRPPRFLTEDPWPWVARVAHNICVDELRSRGRPVVPLSAALTAREDEDDDLELADHRLATDVTFHEVEQLELRRRLRSALSTLTPRQRRVVLLRLVAGWSCEDVARAEGTKVKTVKNVTWQARALLRDAWGADGKGVRPLGWIATAALSLRLALARARARLDEAFSASFAGSSGLVSDRIAAAMLWAGAGVVTLVMTFAGAAPANATFDASSTVGSLASASRHTGALESSSASAGSIRSLTIATSVEATNARLTTSPKTSRTVTPPRGNFTVEVVEPNGHVAWRSELWWRCDPTPPQYVPPGSPVQAPC
jgi:RNA polymerase sigma-70 factor (ECF subfamily)